MEEADHLFIVTDQLTLSDQKLIGRICQVAKKDTKKIKNISIVHNLMKLEEINQVKKDI
jgi:hypothetical protein